MECQTAVTRMRESIPSVSIHQVALKERRAGHPGGTEGQDVGCVKLSLKPAKELRVSGVIYRCSPIIRRKVDRLVSLYRSSESQRCSFLEGARQEDRR